MSRLLPSVTSCLYCFWWQSYKWNHEKILSSQGCCWSWYFVLAIVTLIKTAHMQDSGNAITMTGIMSLRSKKSEFDCQDFSFFPDLLSNILKLCNPGLKLVQTWPVLHLCLKHSSKHDQMATTTCLAAWRMSYCFQESGENSKLGEDKAQTRIHLWGSLNVKRILIGWRVLT